MRASLLTMMAAVLAAAPAAAGEPSRADQILERFEHANQWRDHVMIVAHRAGWKEGGRIVMAENSLASIRHAIALGVEVVELDVQRSKDGEFVIMHDSWLDRTTTCRGEVKAYALADLKTCWLVVEGTGEITGEPVPTLREALLAAKGEILVNIDNKLDLVSLAGMAEIARQTGTARQVIVKQNLWSAGKVAEMRDALATIGHEVNFMPILADDAVGDPDFIEEATKPFAADAVEMIAWRGEAGLTERGGALFSARARAVAARGDWHLWVNTYPIVNKAAGYLSGGRGDELAVAASLPEEVFGFWIDRGATMIQTDEPKAAIEWLEKNGYRVPYTDHEVQASVEVSQ